jgi:hypothetical protein
MKAFLIRALGPLKIGRVKSPQAMNCPADLVEQLEESIAIGTKSLVFGRECCLTIVTGLELLEA